MDIGRLGSLKSKLVLRRLLPTVASSAKDIPVTTDRAFTFATANATDFQFQVNNTLYPQWSSGRRVDWYQHTKLAVGDQGNMLAGSYVTNPQSYIRESRATRLY
eukprot:COSAG02_NODE_36511_length_453_cov_1.403955_2_plen_104_part_00